MQQLGRIPQVGDHILYEGLNLEVIEMSENHAQLIAIKKAEQAKE